MMHSDCPRSNMRSNTGTHPAITTERNIANIRRQIKQLGFSYDWDREFATTDPEYMRWTQWIFLLLFDTWFDRECEWTDTTGKKRIGKGRPISELPIPGYDPRPGRKSRASVPGFIPPRLSGGITRELVRRARHGPCRRRGDQRAFGTRRSPRPAHSSAPVDASHHGLCRPSCRRSRDSSMAGTHQGDAAKLGRTQRRGGGGFLHRAGGGF